MDNKKHFTGILLFIASISLSLCVFMQVLDYSIANVSIPYIAGSLAISQTDGTWVITMFAVGNSIALPLTGWFTTRFGSIKVMVASTLLFTFFSFLCGASVSIEMLVIFRFIQGFVAGPLIPLSQSLMILSYPPERKNLAIAIWTMVALVGPIAGPILGGWITYDYTWPWIFYINIPVGLICAIVIWHLYKDKETETQKIQLDWIGLFLLATCVSTLQILLDKGQQYDWFNSSTIIALAITSFVCLVFLILWEFLDENPIMDLSLFKDRNFSLGTAITALSYMFIFGAIVITPLWLQTYMGYTALWAGLAVSPMGIFPLITAPLVAKLMDRYSNRNLLALSFLIFGVSFYLFTNFTTAISFEDIALSRLFFGLGLCTWLSPLMALTFAYIPREKLPTATGIFHFFRIFMGGVGTSLSVTLWERRGTHHHSNLADSINPLNPNSQNLYSLLESLHIKGQAAVDTVNNLIDVQAFMLSTNDLFYLSLCTFVFFFFASFVFKKRLKNQSSKTHFQE